MRYCSRCGASRRLGAAFCPQCGHALQAHQVPARRKHAPLASYEGMRQLAALMEGQQEWLRRGTLLEPLQRLIDNINLRSDIEEATHLHKAQVLAGHQQYAREQIEQIIDHVRNARRLATAEVDLEVETRRLALQDEMNEREHERSLERMSAQHQHEKEVLQLRAQVELVNKISESFNHLQMLQLEAQMNGQVEIQQMHMLTQLIRQSVTSLAEIDASQLEYARMIKGLNIEHLEDAQSYALMNDLVSAVIDRIAEGITQFGKRKGSDQ